MLYIPFPFYLDREPARKQIVRLQWTYLFVANSTSWQTRTTPKITGAQFLYFEEELKHNVIMTSKWRWRVGEGWVRGVPWITLWVTILVFFETGVGIHRITPLLFKLWSMSLLTFAITANVRDFQILVQWIKIKKIQAGQKHVYSRCVETDFPWTTD